MPHSVVCDRCQQDVTGQQGVMLEIRQVPVRFTAEMGAQGHAQPKIDFLATMCVRCVEHAIASAKRATSTPLAEVEQAPAVIVTH